VRQEHKFCADVYHLLYGYIDHSRPPYFCLDSSAAKVGVKEKKLSDCGVPDFYFYLAGGTKAVTIEAKIVEKGKVKFCGDSEPRHWHTNGHGAYKPVLWIGSDLLFKTYFFWTHETFAAALSPLVGRGKTKNGKNRTLVASLPVRTLTFPTLQELVTHTLCWLKSNGY
jgi:hypothetical protein